MFQHVLDRSSYLRLLEPRDAETLFALVDSNRARLREWLPWLDKNTKVTDSLNFIQGSLNAYAINQGLTAGIWHSEKLAGVVGYHAIDWPNKKASIGYWIGTEGSGKGLVTRSTQALVEHAFKNLGLNRVEIRCATGNLRSQRVPERLGFKLEGVARQAEQLYGRFVDHHVYSCLSEEWKHEN